MNKFIVFIIIFLFVLSTVLVCIFKPKTHKPIVFENKNFQVSMITSKLEIEKPDINVEIEPPKIELPEISLKTETPKVNTNTSKQTTPKTTKTNNSNTPKTVNKNNTTNNQTKVQNNKAEQPVKPADKKPEEKIQEKPKTEIADKPAEIKETPKKEQTKVLTEEEEVIAWNKWRSDLQNKLMRDSKISAPIGTSFMFSFTVDKFGNITNLKTWSSNPSYTSLAVKVIKPLLLSYQHTAILNFPTGSKRVITNVNGGFAMARTSRYSSPSDYNDYERVKK